MGSIWWEKTWGKKEEEELDSKVVAEVVMEAMLWFDLV